MAGGWVSKIKNMFAEDKAEFIGVNTEEFIENSVYNARPTTAGFDVLRATVHRHTEERID